jgi:hypothetical protein
MTSRVVSLLVAGLLALPACAKSEPPAPAEAVPSAAPAPPPEPTPAPAPPPASAAAPSEATTSGDIPTEEDFEEESTTAVTAENLDAQLDALEKEIQAE